MVELQLELDSSGDAELSRAVRGSWFACVHLRVASNWFTELYCDGETGLSLHSAVLQPTVLFPTVQSRVESPGPKANSMVNYFSPQARCRGGKRIIKVQ